MCVFRFRPAGMCVTEHGKKKIHTHAHTESDATGKRPLLQSIPAATAGTGQPAAGTRPNLLEPQNTAERTRNVHVIGNDQFG